MHFFGPHLPYFLPDKWFDLIDPAEVALPESFGDPLIGKPPIQLNYAAYWSTSSFTNEQWKKLIAVYWGYVAMIDFEIGRIMDAARELGVLDDTAVFFCADHGEFTGAHRLNDKGPMMYDDIYNIPFIARIPGVSAVGRSTAFVSLIDLPAPAPRTVSSPPPQVPGATTCAKATAPSTPTPPPPWRPWRASCARASPPPTSWIRARPPCWAPPCPPWRTARAPLLVEAPPAGLPTGA